MGREVIMVPANWVHPRDEDGKYIPLYGYSYAGSAEEWDFSRAQWVAGFVEDYSTTPSGWKPRAPTDTGRYTEYAGARPSPDDYMPDWQTSERTHFMMYEDTSEGTPISPAFSTAEELARWLADTGASAFAGDTATYEQWLSTIQRGFAPSMVMSSAGIESGVAALARATAPNPSRED